jgi:hypothetical protein
VRDVDCSRGQGADLITELEHSVWNGDNRVEIVASDLYVQHLSDQNLPAPPDSPLFLAISYMIKHLWQEYGRGVPAFVASLRSVLDRLDSNFSVRRLELELLHVGRVSLILPYFDILILMLFRYSYRRPSFLTDTSLPCGPRLTRLRRRNMVLSIEQTIT